ncbi:hypothetical protein HDU67_000116 [Dinochytrium kinnereticum]|nr:hypothetical protein HDU67_000116 [Dinochytrium kinnereticum]
MVHANGVWALTSTGQSHPTHMEYGMAAKTDMDNAKYGFPRPEISANGTYWNGDMDRHLQDYSYQNSSDVNQYNRMRHIAALMQEEETFRGLRMQSELQPLYVDDRENIFPTQTSGNSLSDGSPTAPTPASTNTAADASSSTRGNPFSNSPPSGYICKLCFVEGHWLKNCSLYREKRRDTSPACAINPYTGRQFLLSNVTEAKYLQNSSFIEPSSAARIKKEIRPSAPPEGYICRKCNVAGHWIQQCNFNHMKPSTPMPPDSYICKICSVPGHWIYTCPRRRFMPAQLM